MEPRKQLYNNYFRKETITIYDIDKNRIILYNNYFRKETITTEQGG